MMGSFLFVPLDNIRVRYITYHKNGVINYKNIVDCIMKTCKLEGWGALYRGYMALVLSSLPYSMITLNLCEFLRNALGLTMRYK